MTETSNENKELTFPRRNFMVMCNQFTKIEPCRDCPDGNHLFFTSWLNQKHPYGYMVDYFTTKDDAQNAINAYKKRNSDTQLFWNTHIIYKLVDVTKDGA